MGRFIQVQAEVDIQVQVGGEATTATARRHPRGWEVEVVAAHDLEVGTDSRLLAELVAAVATRGGGPVRWRVADPTDDHHRIARAAGFDDRRRLVQLRRSLPLPWSSHLATRPFSPQHDTAGLLRVNNAAFHWHPEQSAWTAEDLGRPMAESWFDPAGLLVHPVDGPLQGFCWTKVHHELDPPVGEIFVIGVHPDHHGLGLGRGLVLAGLDHLAGLGLDQAMLYTEADNEPALGLYAGLGFTIHHPVVVFEHLVDAAP